MALRTGQFISWVRYAIVALAGAVIDVMLVVVLVGMFAWPPAAALPLAIEAALLSNFVCNEAFTFRSSAAQGFSVGALGRLARYERICVAGAIFNFLVTLACIWRGAGIDRAAAGGVLAGGVLNFLLNVPSIWRTWAGKGLRGASPTRT